MHASLRAVGADAETMIDGLIEAVGADGLVVVPTFTYDTPGFDPAITPSRTGALSEALRTRPDAVRSAHHSHSVAAVGRGAAALCAGHDLLAATDIDSPLDRLAMTGGLVVLIGVGHVANTTIHVGEFRAAASYLAIPFDPDWPTGGDDRFAGCSRAFGRLEAPLRERRVIRDGRVGRAVTQVMPGRAVIEETVALLRASPLGFLCTDARCYRCSLSRLRGERDRGAEADRD
ncbi:MAG: AAC(3) family N-acetyltransferase [Gaiella sp.]|nr:AAC(3) family N-acetyltransferase [Gaiella sp.]